MIMARAVFAAQWFAAAALASLSWFIAQASTLDTAERLVGGVGVASAAVAVVYFTLKFSTSQRVSWTDLVADARADATKAREALADEQTRAREDEVAMQERCDTLQADLDTERALRMALEDRGLSDRRRSLEDREDRQ